MDVRSALTQRVQQRILRMRTTFERFDDPTAEREPVGPNWNVRDLAGHMAFWADQAADRIANLARGAPDETYDVDRVNDAVYRKNRRMSFVMLLPQLRDAEQRLLDAIRHAPADMLIDSPVRDWIDQAGIRHYDHHWPGLSNAATRAGLG